MGLGLIFSNVNKEREGARGRRGMGEREKERQRLVMLLRLVLNPWAQATSCLSLLYSMDYRCRPLWPAMTSVFKLGTYVYMYVKALLSWWLIPIILATQEAEIRKITV
jgi:hypothetical protein